MTTQSTQTQPQSQRTSTPVAQQQDFTGRDALNVSAQMSNATPQPDETPPLTHRQKAYDEDPRPITSKYYGEEPRES